MIPGTYDVSHHYISLYLYSLYINRAWFFDYLKLRNIGQQFPRSIEMDFGE